MLLPCSLIAFALAMLFYSVWIQRKLNSKRYLWTEVGDEALPTAIRNEIPQFDREFLKVGFRFCANYRCVFRLLNSVSRQFIHDSGVVKAVIAKEAIVLQTLFSNGHILETASTDTQSDDFKELEESRLHLVAAGTNDISRLLKRHNCELESIAARLSTQPVSIASGMFPELGRYLLALCDWDLYRKGKMIDPPFPTHFELPFEKSDRIVFPSPEAFECEAKARKRPQKRRSQKSLLPKTGDDYKSLAICFVFYTAITAGGGTFMVQRMLDRQNANPEASSLFFWSSLYGFSIVGMGISLLFYARWKWDTNQLQAQCE